MIIICIYCSFWPLGTQFANEVVPSPHSIVVLTNYNLAITTYHTHHVIVMIMLLFMHKQYPQHHHYALPTHTHIPVRYRSVKTTVQLIEAPPISLTRDTVLVLHAFIIVIISCTHPLQRVDHRYPPICRCEDRVRCQIIAQG